MAFFLRRKYIIKHSIITPREKAMRKGYFIVPTCRSQKNWIVDYQQLTNLGGSKIANFL